MKIHYRIIILTVLVAFSWTLSAPKKSLKTVIDLDKYLTEAYEKSHANINVLDLHLYTKAQKRISDLSNSVSEKPDDPTIAVKFHACSLLTEAAVYQIKTKTNEVKMNTLNEKTIGILQVLATVYKSINTLENKKFKKEMEKESKRFQEQLKQEQLKAEKLKEDAQLKFKALQNSLIQVKNDARGTIISMSDILFPVNKARLSSDLKTSLAKIAGILTVFKNSTIVIEGHTDNTGSLKHNLKLSKERANNVMNFMIAQGVASSRLSAVGHGFYKPVASNKTSKGRKQNRRVDLIIQELNDQEQIESIVANTVTKKQEKKDEEKSDGKEEEVVTEPIVSPVEEAEEKELTDFEGFEEMAEMEASGEDF